MKKVLLVATVQSHICQFHKPLAEMLRESGEVEIHVAARDNLDEKDGLKLDFADRVFDIPFERSPFSVKNIKAFMMLKRLIDRGNYDIIHCNTPVGGILTRLAAGDARKKGAKVFYTAHGFHFYKGAPAKNWLIYYLIEKIFSRKTDALITINEEDYQLAKRKFRCKTFRIHGAGVDPARFYTPNSSERRTLKKALGLSGQIILCVGELLPNKNQAMALYAMQKVVHALPQATLLLAGNGPEKEKLKSLSAKLGLKNNVKLIGYRFNIEKYQQAADMAISCSRREGLGLNMIEAMLTGTPVAATKNRGHTELIEDGNNGILIPLGDSDALADAVIEILTNEQLAQHYAENGRRIAERYTTCEVKKELSAIYNGV